jgi:hypothetical protein
MVAIKEASIVVEMSSDMCTKNEIQIGPEGQETNDPDDRDWSYTHPGMKTQGTDVFLFPAPHSSFALYPCPLSNSVSLAHPSRYSSPSSSFHPL